MKESVGDFVEIRSWQGMVGPRGVPREIVDALSKEILAVTAVPEFRTRLAPLGFELLPFNAQQLSAYMASEYAKWEQLANAAGRQPQKRKQDRRPRKNRRTCPPAPARCISSRWCSMD